MQAHLIQSLPTCGARAVEPFWHAGKLYLAVAQLAQNTPGETPGMNAGNSNVDAIIYRWADDRFVEDGRIPVPGGEDVEYFIIGERAFLATASLRSGSGPYELNVDSVLYEIRGDSFVEFQRFPTFAAKQWRHFEVNGRHFLALAQGVVMQGLVATHPSHSCLFEWDGKQFVHFQDVLSAWGYNWAPMQMGEEFYLGYADHVAPSQLLRWTGTNFEPWQEFEGNSGRAMCAFDAHGERWLAFARLHGDSTLYKWSGKQFAAQQTLSGPGAREYEWIADGDGGYLVQVNFLHGTREAPKPDLYSCIYDFREESPVAIQEFPTFGGTDAARFDVGGCTYLVVANSLSADVMFRVDSQVYFLNT
jgi:hypothetical protein